MVPVGPLQTDEVQGLDGFEHPATATIENASASRMKSERPLTMTPHTVSAVHSGLEPAAARQHARAVS